MSKNEIIKKIEELFFEKSFKWVSMQDIANDLWMKKASLYYYFPSKDKLIIEILEDSFEKYLWFIKETIEIWNENNFKELLGNFLDFWDKEKNIFSVINQNWYSENDEIFEYLQEKQKVIFETIFDWMNKKAGFSKEKAFLFLSLINDIWRRKTTYGKCGINREKMINEVERLFF
jgi:AcrR family transcriptional regulator